MVQDGFEPEHVGGGLVAEEDDEPGAAGWDADGGMAAAARGAVAGCGGPEGAAGGEVGEEFREAAIGAGEAGPEGDSPVPEQAEAGGDEDREGGEDGIEPPGEVRGGIGGGWRGGR